MSWLEDYNKRRKMFKDKAKEIHPVRFTYGQINMLESILQGANVADFYPREINIIYIKIVNAEAKEEVANNE